MRRLVSLALGLVLPLLPGSAAMAETTEELLQGLRKEMDALREGQAQVLRELQELRALLRTRAAPAPEEPLNVALSLDGAVFKGEPGAPLVLFEFTDYQCPFCARHVRETMTHLERDYINTGKLRYVIRDFPLESIHPQAFKAAEAAHCAREQGKYWEMHARLFANQRALGSSDLSGHAQGLGLDAAKFQQCLDSGKYAAAIRRDLAEGTKAGIRGTPTFFLGTVEDGSKVKVLRVIRGAQPFQALKATIDAALPAKP